MNLQYHFNELFQLVYQLKKNDFATVHYDDLRKQIKDIITRIKLRVGDSASHDFKMALFAVCAWIDELIQNSNWSGKTQWQELLLQTEYFDTTDAGDEFFDYLAKIPLNKTDLIRIYYRCIALGFKGEHHKSVSFPELFRFKSYALEQLTQDHGFKENVNAITIYPEAYTSEDTHGKKLFSGRRIWKKILWWLLPIPVLGVFYIFFYLVIHNTVTNYIEMIN
ncbi:DotU family type IV/VI secretion system protein [Legionella spiritensis]|uniref:Type IV / VI secretion system DotU domain-containing protein n=1 Tax=Legionella spiritensis TaxID=452 RepID=A0A0W0Z9D0_LEGSP|nr:DotU family type IV/VI secretion system protein [Legionella spiritensis]KTD65730.1 hypothetical protein Lspi_0442 [Legionella spiritensis]SNV43208.1 Uncharacterized protein conserved in bacteria [Legionella spiritensis]